MSTVYVIHADNDRDLVEHRLLRSLPSNGYDRWLSRQHLVDPAHPDPDPVQQLVTEAINRSASVKLTMCPVVLIVVSTLLLESAEACREIALALDVQRGGSVTVIVILTGTLEDHDKARFPTHLWDLPRIDFAVEKEVKVDRLLAALLPPIDAVAERLGPMEATRLIKWNEEILSESLTEATSRHDHARARLLVEALVAHLGDRLDPYPPQYACKDLQALRQEREFQLMRRYGEAVTASGTQQDRVRRLFAQALIETGDHEYALRVLQSIIDDPDASRDEVFEAYGLKGRSFKQRYVNAPRAPGAEELLCQAIAAYEAVYVQDRLRFWHGVNAASCLLRADRDHVVTATPPERAREIALQVVQDLEAAARATALDVWDWASWAEALLALQRYDEAGHVLEAYLHHPEMRAFEVSSTFRQFREVLELNRDPQGVALLARLQAAVERYRTDRPLAAYVTAPGSAPLESPQAPVTSSRPLVIRLGSPAWEPDGVTDLRIESRLGKIITARGTDVSVQQLLADPMVISVEDSRPAGGVECVRSLPFIKVAAEYQTPVGKIQERGDRALIAVIDDGIDVLHESFLDAQHRSRIVGIWDQTARAGTPPTGFSYGHFHDAAAIDKYVKSRTVPLEDDFLKAARDLGRNANGHGTHVASIAAGQAVGEFAGGVAPEAKLLIVRSAGHGPIGYSVTHIEALKFIDTVATKLGLPVVVNLSQGMNAGAHDGKSALEVAFDEFSESGRRPGRVVVKSAGNERAKNGHACITLTPQALEELHWNRLAGAARSERIELWWNSAVQVRFCLCDPYGERSAWIDTTAPESEVKGTFSRGGPYRLAFTKHHIDNGDSLLLIELGDAIGTAGLGEWVLDMHCTAAPRNGEIHAWIERAQGTPTEFSNHLNENHTLSIPATASSVIAVGAVDASQPLRLGKFSSYGPTRDGRYKPLVCAPGVEVQAARGGTDQGICPMSGTSMAAPHVSGAIALMLSKTSKAGRRLSATQIAAVLSQKTQNFNGDWHHGQGYGVIDVAALLAAF